jgi:uncharacterized protein
MRRFMGGAIWGAIVGVLGLGVVSQLAPVPGEKADTPVVVAEPAVDAAIADPVPDVAVADPLPMPELVAVPEPVPEQIAEPVPDMAPAAPAPQVTAVAPEQAVTPDTTVTDEAMLADAATTTPAAPTAPLTPPQTEMAPVPVQAPAEPPAVPETDAQMVQALPETTVQTPAPAADAPAELTLVDSGAPATPAADAAPAPAELPLPPPLTADEQALLDAAMAGAAPLEPVESPIVDAPVTETAPDPAPVAPAEAVPAADAAPDGATLAPEPGFTSTGLIDDAAPSTLAPTPPLGTEGAVIQRRLPQVDEAEVVPETDTLPEVTGDDLPPLTRFAAAFENPDAKPLFSLVLIDDGAVDLDRAALAALPFAVSFVVDPLAPGAADAAAIYRAGGKEVLMLATGIPDGATPADLEQTFQAHAAALPEAVAVIDLADAGFQGDRALATQLVPILAAQGRGLLTWDRGLNAADQVARREALPTAMVFRALDAAGEDAPLIRRYLDRAAFKAAQEGAVTVVGQTRPETIAALLEWAVEGRASTVALAPVSAVLAGQ